MGNRGDDRDVHAEGGAACGLRHGGTERSWHRRSIAAGVRSEADGHPEQSAQAAEQRARVHERRKPAHSSCERGHFGCAGGRQTGADLLDGAVRSGKADAQHASGWNRSETRDAHRLFRASGSAQEPDNRICRGLASRPRAKESAESPNEHTESRDVNGEDSVHRVPTCLEVPEERPHHEGWTPGAGRGSGAQRRPITLTPVDAGRVVADARSAPTVSAPCLRSPHRPRRLGCACRHSSTGTGGSAVSAMSVTSSSEAVNQSQRFRPGTRRTSALPVGGTSARIGLLEKAQHC